MAAEEEPDPADIVTLAEDVAFNQWKIKEAIKTLTEAVEANDGDGYEDPFNERGSARLNSDSECQGELELLKEQVRKSIKILRKVKHSQEDMKTNGSVVSLINQNIQGRDRVLGEMRNGIQINDIERRVVGGYNHRAKGRRSRKKGRSVSLRSKSKPRSRTRSKSRRSSSRSK